jgi:hypothetical protein
MANTNRQGHSRDRKPFDEPPIMKNVLTSMVVSG